jgi:hypothetical protein
MRRLATAALGAVLAATSLGATTDNGSQPQAAAGDVEPRLIWGVLIRFAASEVFSAFSRWVIASVGERQAIEHAGTPSSMPTPQVLVEQLRLRKDTTGGAIIAPNPTAAAVVLPDMAATRFERPATPIKVGASGVNYQGVHIAIVGVDQAGGLTELRALGSGFRTGERFKLRALSTFGGLLVIDNINPRGERRQIYPPERSAVVVLQPGGDTLLPLASDQFFEFAYAKGDEQLVISLRDRRAIGDALARSRVYRKDEDFGSLFMQEVSPGTFPAISESMRLRHQ